MNRTPTANPRAAALIIVLAFLVLISVLMVAFFSSVTAQLAASRSAANSANVHQLADSAVNVVMAQLVDATKGQASGEILAWASQPGMIRTYGAVGQPREFFKLYSSDKMTVSGQGFTTDTDLPPADWNAPTNRELYTDLNKPGVDAKGLLVYPIIDPAADGRTSPGRPNDGMKVDGFSLTSSPGFVPANTEAVGNNRAPMPVKWLYVLKDGSLKPATPGSAGAVTVADATATNPIVGRIAFWTDDETTKVNINTASEGTYWDMPRIYSPEDYGFARSGVVTWPGFAVCQPVQHEYQRYPGHPATTCLSPILGSLLPVPFPYPPAPSSSDSSQLDPYYDIAPRIGLPGRGGGGGSQGGSAQVPNTTAALLTDTERLYASVDELMFTPSLSGTSRIPNTATDKAPYVITKGVLEKAKFFLTAHSSAPEVTLYNTPRVAVWPISPARTPFDSLLAFCSTIGGKEYFFTRTNARSPTADYSGRNKMLYEYLQAQTKENVPGFGGNFLSKYPAGSTGVTDRDQILTYIFDYIRSTNLQDQSYGATPFTPLFANGVPEGAGEVIPIRINQTMGFGRFYSVTSANLLFYGTGPDKMRAVFFLAPTTPMQGLACMRAGVKYKVVKGLEGLQANGNSLNFRYDPATGNGTNYIDRADLYNFHGRSVGGTESPWPAMRDKPFADDDAGGDARRKYPFFSAQDVDVSGSADTGFSFTSTSEIVVEIRTYDTDELVQTLRFKFPDGKFKVPGVIGGSSATFASRGMGGEYSRLVNPLDTVVSLQVGGWDTTKNASPEPELDATVGDVRMVAGLADVPSSRYRADQNYTTSNVQFAHSLVQSIGVSFVGSKYGKLAPVATYQQSNILRQPDVPSRAANGVTRKDGGPGDWDTGIGDQKDGAHINKPDEGDTSLTDGRTPYMLGYNRGFSSATNTYFSPNRQIPSPLMLGSIPTGVQRMLPWQTLLFHPRPEDPTHPGHAGPKDHLLADLFWMPVVEPYAISQPFATAGKINLNYQIVPFTYINRATGLHAVMKATKFAAFDPAICRDYKNLDVSGQAPKVPNQRRAIDMTKTLAEFETKFKSNEIFKSATQICEMNLVPSEVGGASDMGAFWNANFFTGDNLREKPYVDLYSRLTTKSNTYTVHVCVQTLKKAPGTPPDQWTGGGRDQVVGEYRGLTVLERYIDLNDPKLPDFAAKFAADPKDSALNIDQYYRMRVVSKKRFAP